jgi:hypothetical protein
MPQRPVPVFARDRFTGDAYRGDVLTLVRKLSGIVQYEDRPLHCSRALASRLEVSRQNLRFTHAIVIEESIRRLGVRPVLAGQRNALAGTCRQAL